jgi:hypothetical protein
MMETAVDARTIHKQFHHALTSSLLPQMGGKVSPVGVENRKRHSIASCRSFSVSGFCSANLTCLMSVMPDLSWFETAMESVRLPHPSSKS